MNLSHDFYQRCHQKFYTLVALLSVSVLSSCSKVSSEPNETPYYQAADIINIDLQQKFTINREYIGRVVAKQQTSLSFEYAGRVKAVLVDSGEHVTKGQVLAEQDTELLAIKASELKAQIKQVEAQIVLNNANLKRVNALIEDGYASEQNVDELNAEQGVLAANREGLLASLASLTYQITKGKLTAPYQGILSERFIAEGDIVANASPAFKLIKQSQQEVTLGIPYEAAATLSTNDELQITINQVSLTARVLSIGQEINSINRTVQIRLALDQANDRYNGQLARVHIEDEKLKPGYWVPISALTDGIRGQWNIYQALQQTDGLYQVTALIVDVMYTTQDRAYISVAHTEPLDIVASGLHRYVPGQLIRHSTTAANKQGAQ